MKGRTRETNWQALFFELTRLGFRPWEISQLTVEQVNMLMSELSQRRQADKRSISRLSGRKFGLFNVCVVNRSP